MWDYIIPRNGEQDIVCDGIQTPPIQEIGNTKYFRGEVIRCNKYGWSYSRFIACQPDMVDESESIYLE